MALSLHTQKSIKTTKAGKRRGRGLASGRGRYSGRGMKGQKSRSGGKGGLKLKGMKANMQNIPKLPGFNSNKPKMATVNVDILEKTFKAGDKVTATILKKFGVIETSKHGLKILGNGKITKKLVIFADATSATAQKAVEAAGGVIKIAKKYKVEKKPWTPKEAVAKTEKKETKKGAKKVVKSDKK